MQLDHIAAYWDTRAEGYSETVLEELSGESAKSFDERLRAAMPAGEGLTCLDMGCGPGFFTVLLKRMGHTVTSADYSEEMLERTKRNCLEAGFEADTVRADAQALPFEDGRFDFLCSRNLVWNLEKPEKAYGEWLRVLKPGGRMLIFDGNYYLHYFDEDYRKAAVWKDEKRPGGHSTKGVDPTPINEIARSLPLSGQKRPEWDLKVLPEIGFRVVSVERFTQEYTDIDTGEARSIVYSFALVCEKPEADA